MNQRTPGNDSSVNKIFGVDVPQASSDERDVDASRDELERDEWLRDNIPPHHG